MNPLYLVILALFYLVFPAVLIKLSLSYSIIKKIGLVMVAYIVGMLISLLGLLPENAKELQSTFTDVTIPLALPLLLFSLNIKNLVKLARNTFISLIIGISALLITVISGYYMFKDAIPEAWKISGMMLGVSTGGTPNLVSIKTALDVNADAYIATHTLDTIFSLIYIVFLITFAQKVFGIVLPKYKFSNTAIESGAEENDVEDFSQLTKKESWLPLLKAFGLSVLILLVALGIGKLVPASSFTMVAILVITTLGIGLSMVPRIHNLPNTFQLGMYLILIFCLVVASMVNLDNLMATSWQLVAYVFWAIFGTLILHVFISSLFKVDTDTTIITSTALICSPPFVPVVAAGIKNKEVIISGITVGIIGYAIGNYLGIATALLLK